MAGILSVTASDRLMRALRGIVREEFPRLTFFGHFEYVVQPSSATDGSTVDIAPTDPSYGLPSITQVPLRLSANVSAPQVGQRVLVIFVNNDPGRPMILGTDPVPATSTYDATGTLNLGPSSSLVSIAGGSVALTPAPAFSLVLTALRAFATAVGAATSLGQVTSAGGTLSTSLAAVTSIATTKTKAT